VEGAAGVFVRGASLKVLFVSSDRSLAVSSRLNSDHASGNFGVDDLDSRHVTRGEMRPLADPRHFRMVLEAKIEPDICRAA
jgi:hypothetical protein